MLMQDGPVGSVLKLFFRGGPIHFLNIQKSSDSTSEAMMLLVIGK